MTDQATEFIRQAMPLGETLGISAEEVTAQKVVLFLDWAPELCTANGILHGGTIMALADAAAGTCAFLNLPPGASTATIQSSTNFLAAVRDGTVRATAMPVHVGSRTIAVETAVTNGDRLVAKVLQSQAILTG